MNTKPKPRITKITLGRLYNLGNYEHVRYDLTVEVPDGASATKSILGMERIIAGLSPLKNARVRDVGDLRRDAAYIAKLKSLNAEEWKREHGESKGTRKEIIGRYEKALRDETLKRQKELRTAERARLLFDDLGGAARWKDAKLDWENDDQW